MYVHAITNIKAGNVIAENYGPLYSQNPLQERKSTLKDQYWFDCNCRPCTDNWPLYDEMNTKEIRFKYMNNLHFCQNLPNFFRIIGVMVKFHVTMCSPFRSIVTPSW